MILFEYAKMQKDVLYVLEYNQHNTNLLSDGDEYDEDLKHSIYEYIYYIYHENDDFRIHSCSKDRLAGRTFVQCLNDDIDNNILDFNYIVELTFNKNNQLIYKQTRAKRIKLRRHRHKETLK